MEVVRMVNRRSSNLFGRVGMGFSGGGCGRERSILLFSE